LSTLEATKEAILSEQLASEDEVTAALATLQHFTADRRLLIRSGRQIGKAGERYGQRYLPAAPDGRSARRCTALSERATDRTR
jgi:hypothetical protein